MRGDPRLCLLVVQELQRLGVVLPRHKRNDLRRSIKMVKTANKNKSFGVPLQVVVATQGVIADDLRVPRVVKQIGDILCKDVGTEGLFRVCGSAARMRKIEAGIDAGDDVTGTVHDVAGLLKKFFRDMPEPLLTYRLYGSFVMAFQIENEPDRVRAISLLCLELPVAHLHTLIFVCRLLRQVVHNHSSTKMTASNLAAILTPNILRPHDDDPKTKTRAATTTAFELSNHAHCVGIVELLIIQSEHLGQPPQDLLQRAMEMPNVDSARKDYAKLTEVKTGWWRRRRNKDSENLPFDSRAAAHGRKLKTSLSSANTLALIHGKNNTGSNSPRMSPHVSARLQHSEVLSSASSSSPLAAGKQVPGSDFRDNHLPSNASDKENSTPKDTTRVAAAAVRTRKKPRKSSEATFNDTADQTQRSPRSPRKTPEGLDSVAIDSVAIY